jgi:hypothetical protein
MADRTPRTLAPTGTGGEGVGNAGRGPAYPEQNPEQTQGGAPGGAFFSEGELPVISTFAPPATLNGYSADPGRVPQVSNVQDPRGLGVTAPLSGARR